VELIVVIAILGILVTLALPRLMVSRDSARENAHKTNMKTLKSAANIAVAEHGAPNSRVVWDSVKKDETDDYASRHYIEEWPENPFPENKGQGRNYMVTINEDGEVSVELK